MSVDIPGLLRRLEWASNLYGASCCPECFGVAPDPEKINPHPHRPPGVASDVPIGHREDCELAKAIAETGASAA